MLAGDDQVHAYANFYFRMEEKNLQEEEQAQTEMIDLQESSRNAPSSFVSALTASSLQSLPDSNTFSTVECWLENLEELPGHDHDDTFENISDVYDIPYKKNLNNASSLNQTQFMNIFIKSDLPPPEPQYENLPIKPSPLNPRPLSTKSKRN